jgi:hypothetical protein
MRKGSETSQAKTSAAKPKDTDAPDAAIQPAKKVAPAPAKAEPVTAPPPAPTPAPVIEKKPEPIVEKKPEPKPEPKPDPVVEKKPDLIAQTLGRAEPLPEPPKTQPEPKAEAPKAAAKPVDPIAEQLAKTAKDPLPAKEPPQQQARADIPPPKVKAPKKKGIDLAKLQAQISQLADAAPESGADAPPDPTAATQAPAIGVKHPTGTQLSATEQQMFLGIFSQKVKECWTVLAGAADGAELVVPVSFDLAPDGTLQGEPRVTGGGGSPSFAIAAENAVNAIRQCAPYPLPAAQYAKWQHWDINFDPRAMFGG